MSDFKSVWSRRLLLALLSPAIVALGVCAVSAPAFAQTTHRPIAEFVAAQGTFCVPDGAGGCVVFVPPVANFVGFTDTVNDRAISVDYAGLANDALGGALGTTFSGTVSERPLKDGRALIHVNLHTSNALAWVIPFDPASTENQFGNNPLLFGARVPDVQAGAAPSLADSVFTIEFVSPAPGLPLPDLEQLLFAPETGQELRSVVFEATANGTFADGTPGKVHVIERGIFDNGFHGAVGDGFPVETINLIPQ
jgi:hypothetical protein